MIRYILFSIAFVLAYIPSSIAWDIPYGVQDPFRSTSFVTCSGGEIGYWQLLVQESSDKKSTFASLVLTTVDLLDPAFVICHVPADRKVLVMEPGHGL